MSVGGPDRAADMFMLIYKCLQALDSPVLTPGRCQVNDRGDRAKIVDRRLPPSAEEIFK
jgi:hypothetical protein